MEDLHHIKSCEFLSELIEAWPQLNIVDQAQLSGMADGMLRVRKTQKE